MNDQDYILLFDENGQPYIAHASLSGLRQRASGAVRAVGQAAANAAGAAKEGVGRGVRTTHKYIQKIEENGRTRYFYTQEELKAYYAEKKAAAQQTVNNVKKKASETMSEAQEKAAHARTRAEQMSKEFQKKAGDTVQTAKNYGEAVKNYRDLNKAEPVGTQRKEAYDKLMSTKEGRKLREAHLKAWDTLDETAIKAASHLKGAKEWDDWKKAAENNRQNPSEENTAKEAAAWEAYEKTPHYKALNDNFIVDAQTNGLKDATTDAIDYAKSKVKQTAKNAKDVAESAADAIKDKASDVASDISAEATKVKKELHDKITEHNGSPSNSEGETRSMLGSYAINIPSEPDKLKEWADKGKEQAQQIIDEAESEFKKIEQDFKNGKITQQQMWIAQGIMEGLRDEMSEWDYLSSMNPEQLTQLFGPLLKK